MAAGFLAPLEVGIDDEAFGDERRGVALVERKVAVFGADGVAEASVIPLERADMGARVGIEQKLVGIEAMTFLGLIGSVNAIAVYRARL